MAPVPLGRLVPFQKAPVDDRRVAGEQQSDRLAAPPLQQGPEPRKRDGLEIVFQNHRAPRGHHLVRRVVEDLHGPHAQGHLLFPAAEANGVEKPLLYVVFGKQGKAQALGEPPGQMAFARGGHAAH